MHSKITAGASLAALACLLAVPAVAQTDADADNDNPDEIIVTGQMTAFGATKGDTPIVETARSVSIETSDMFIEKGALTFSQVLTYQAGVSGEPYGLSTRGDFVTSRGLSIPRYRDSIQELFGSYNSTRADVYTIEQVEVLKGPASVLYGQGSPGGLVNYVSKTPQSETGGEVAVQLGSYDRYQIAADATGPIAGTDGQLLYRMVGLYRDTGTQIDEVDETTYVIMPSLTWQPSADTRFTLIGLHQDTRSDTAAQFIPVEGTLLPLADGSYLDYEVYAGEPGFNRFDTTSTQATLLAEHRLNDQITFEGTALWRSGEADYHQAWPAFTGAGQSRYLNDIVGAPLFTDTTVARTFYQGDNSFDQLAADGRIRAGFVTGPLDHEVLAGIQYQTVETDSNLSYFFGGGALAGDFRYVLDLANPVYTGAPDQSVFDAIYTDNPVQTVDDLGLYISDQIAWNDWRFTLGVRADKVSNEQGAVSQDDDALSFSAGALYRFDNGLSPYISYAESFEPVLGLDNDGNALKPEEGRQFEAGLKYEPGALPGLITLAVYDIEVSNLPNPNALPATASQQQGVSTLRGVELEAQLQFDQVFLQAAASAQDAEDPNGFALASQPDKQASLWVSWRPDQSWDGFKLGGGVRYVGESVSEDGTIRYETPSYVLADAMIGYEWDRWDLAVNARNITDEAYLTACLTRGDCFPGLRRSVVASLSYRY